MDFQAGRSPRVADVMQTDFVTVDVKMPLEVAAACMRRHDVRCLPVTENGAPIGMLTDRDLVVRALAHSGHVERWRVGDVMSVGLISISPERSVEDARRLMMAGGVRRLVVLDDDWHLVGLLEEEDLDGLRNGRTPERHVVFSRRVIDSRGRAHEVEVAKVYVSAGVPPNFVSEVAIERFQRSRGGVRWETVADGYSVHPAERSAAADGEEARWTR
ncbi:MAG: CBS domain-containing protein [Pseudomonadota bacterium]